MTILPFSYILYGIAEILSKEHIRTIVNFMPDSYTTAIYFFAIFYVTCISIILFMAISAFILMIYCVFSTLKDIEFIKSLFSGLAA
ncbi:hypothetical protein ACWIUD_04720 [Helicobacter sp. 23-1044]